MSLIWPIPPLPMLCWCFTGITFTYSSYSSLPDTCPAPTSSYVQSYITTFPFSHIPTYSHIHILSYSPMFPYSDTISHRHLPCPHHILTGTCPVLCSSNGEYEEGACRCYPGWKGAECSIRHNECEVSLLNRIVHSA